MRYKWPSGDMAGGAQGGDRCSGTWVLHGRPGETALIDSLSQSLAHLSVWPQPSTAPAPLGSLIVGAPHHKEHGPAPLRKMLAPKQPNHALRKRYRIRDAN